MATAEGAPLAAASRRLRPSLAGGALMGYLVATLPPLVAGGVGGPRGGVMAVHVIGLGAVALLEARRGRAGRGLLERVLADGWLLLLLLPALYAEIPWLIGPWSGGYHDPAIAALDVGLFGTEPSYAWAGAWPFPWLSETLHAAYVSFYAVIYVPPLLLYRTAWRRSEVGADAPGAGGVSTPALDAFRTTTGALALSILACYAVFVVWPVQGPRYLGVPPGVPAGPVRALVLGILERGSSRGAAFPSSHVAVAVTQTLMALRFQPRVGRALVVITPLLAAGAVYGGFHYATDVLVGAVVGVLAAAAARPLERRIHGSLPGFTWREDAV